MMKLKYFISLYILICTFALYAQRAPVSNSLILNTSTAKYFRNKAEFKQKSNPDSITLPLKRAGNLLVLETTIDGVKGNLIFDSGSMALLVLNKTYFRNHKVRSKEFTQGINGRQEAIEIISVDSMMISDLIFTDISANLANLSHIENQKGVKILGFFGLELLQQYSLLLDVNQNVLHLYHQKNAKDAIKKIETQCDYVQDAEILNNIVFIWGKIGKTHLKFCFDTGAEKNVLGTHLSKKVMSSITFTGRLRVNDAGRSASEVLYGTMNQFEFGDKHLKSMEVIVSNITPLSTIYSIPIAGVLGYDFMSKGKIYIHYSDQKFGIIYQK